MPTKLYKYELWLKSKKCRPCEYLSDYFEAADFWDTNLYVHKFLEKLRVIKVLQCKIKEVDTKNPLDKIQWFDCEGMPCKSPFLKGGQ